MTNARENLVVALLREGTVAKAAAACGITERTAYRHLALPEMAAELRRARQQAVDQAVTALSGAATAAAAILRAIAEDESAPPAVRVSAAARILDLVMKVSDDTEQRLLAVEEQLRQLLGRNGKVNLA